MKNNNPFGDLNVVCALGDHYSGSIRILRNAGIELYNPEKIENGRLAPLTGDECKRVEGKIVNHAPDFALFTDDPEYDSNTPRIAIFYPQDHPMFLEKGKIDMAIGPGYDILINYTRERLILNGEFKEESERESLMRDELNKKAGYKVAVPLGFKPVVFNLVTNQKYLRTLHDMKKYGKRITGLTVCPHILREFFRQKKIKGEVLAGFGAIEAMLKAGCGNVMSDVTETGRSLEDDDSLWWIVDEETGELEIVTYTGPFLVVSESGYKKESKIIDELVEKLEGDGGAIEATRKQYPEMFKEKYRNFLIKKTQEELNELGMIA